jgi:formylglycine-generating enzyme required for sulfatase activity
MAWPLSQDYNEAIQDPATSFGDADLKQGEAATNALGIPMPRSGNFADVYEVTTPRGKWAIKCFTRQIPGLRERYKEVSAYLKQSPLPFMVDFTYLEQGIRVRGEWYPVLKMQWVEGFNLNQFVKDNLERPQILDVLCQIWAKLAARLRETQIAHCDLQHGNVLLVPGSKAGALAVKLVDYDGMCVPALTMLKTIEVGHPNFQHPQRAKEGIYSLEVDRFSHLVIYTAIRALMTGGKALWAKYDNGDNLLFKASDFEKPQQSPLFAELAKYPDPGVQMLAAEMLEALRKPLNESPRLEEVVARLPVSAPKLKTSVKTTKTEDVFAQATSGGRKSQLGKKKSSAGLLVGAAVGGVLAVAAVIGGLVFLKKDKPPEEAVVVKKETEPAKKAETKKTAIETKKTPIETKKNPEPTPEEPKANPKPPEPTPEPGADAQLVGPDRAELVKLLTGKQWFWHWETVARDKPFRYLANGDTDHEKNVWSLQRRWVIKQRDHYLLWVDDHTLRGFFIPTGRQVGVSAKPDAERPMPKQDSEPRKEDDLLAGPDRAELIKLLTSKTWHWHWEKANFDSPFRYLANGDTESQGKRESAVWSLEQRWVIKHHQHYLLWIDDNTLRGFFIATGRRVGAIADVGSAPERADRSITNSLGMKLVPIRAGTFTMGSSPKEIERCIELKLAWPGPDLFKSQGPQHDVEIGRPFYMGAHHVTVGQFQAFVTESKYQGGGAWPRPAWEQTDEHPVVNVSSNDAQAFCTWLSQKERKRYRLPTEAEWEYCCRAGQAGTRYYFGSKDSDLVLHAWYKANSKASTHLVGQLKANSWGLYDMHGNAWQWCQDSYGIDYYRSSPRQNPTGPDSGGTRVLRGGAWDCEPVHCGAAFRRPNDAGLRSYNFGFRVVLEGAPSDPSVRTQPAEKKLEILFSAYGSDDFWVDMTERLRPFVKQQRLELATTADLVGAYDPTPNRAKALLVLYRTGDDTFLHIVAQDQAVRIPVATSVKLSADQGEKGLAVLHAIYGSHGSWADVSDRVRPLLKESRLKLTSTEELVGALDPAPGKHKALIVVCSSGGNIFVRTLGQDQKTPLVITPWTPARPIAVWTFEKDARDSVGNLHGKLMGMATVTKGRLRLAGRRAGMEAGPLPEDVKEKTLEMWVSLPDIQKPSFVMGMYNSKTDAWDGLVFGAIQNGDRPGQSRKWQLRSSYNQRNGDPDGPLESAKPNERVHLAVSCANDGSIALYRNGQAYGFPAMPRGPNAELQTFHKKTSRILFGAALWQDVVPQVEIEEARLYDRALTASEVAASFEKGYEGARSLEAKPESGGVDLLKLISPEKHTVAGKWRFEDGSLIGEGDTPRVFIPYEVPKNYRLRLNVERLSGDEFVVGLVTPESQCLAVFDAVPERGFLSGFEMIDGVVIGANKSAVKGQLLAKGRSARIEFLVRKDAIEARVNDKVAFIYKGSFRRLSLHPFWAAPEKHRLFIGSKGNSRISSCELTPAVTRAPAGKP